MRIVLVAVPGAGKSTIMKAAQKLKPDIKIVNFGDQMLKIAKERYGIQDRDEMRKRLSLEAYQALQEEAAKEIASFSGDLLIDTHASVKMARGFYPGLPDRVAELLKPDVILLLEFDPQVVLQRRLKDISLKAPETTAVGSVSIPRAGRDLETPEEVELQQQVNRGYAIAAANAARCAVKVLNLRTPEKRPFEHAEIGAQVILELLKTP